MNYLTPLRKIKHEYQQMEKDSNMTDVSISFEKLRQLLREKNLFTTFCHTDLPEQVKNILDEAWEQNFVVDSSCGVITKTTPTLSTTVAGLADIVDVQDCKDYPSNLVEEDLFGFMNTPDDNYSISQTICKNLPDKYCTVTSPGETGQYLVKLDFYRVKDIQNMPKNQWWRMAEIRMNYLIQSNVDPLQILLTKTVKEVTQRLAKIKNLKKRDCAENLVQFFKQFPTAPLRNIIFTKIWYNSPYKYYTSGNVILETAFDIWKSEINDLSIEGLYKLYEYSTPLFAAQPSSIDTYYFPRGETVEILNELLLYQFNHITLVLDFLTNLLNVIHKLIPQKNTLMILGEPGAGKTYFIDMVLHYCLNFGQIGNFNKYCNFPLQDCINRRILLFNEPNIDAGSLETLKLVLGGDSCATKIKYKDDVILFRTPVLITSNRNVFPNNEAFQQRMYIYNWKRAPYLQQYEKKLHPLGFYDLLKQHDLL